MEKEALIKELQARFERMQREKEIQITEHWKEQLDRVMSLKPEGLAALQMQIKKVSEMMANRIKYLKKG